MANSSPDSLMKRQMLGPYRIERKRGSGGMGEVYQAIDSRLDRLVAIKILPPEAVRDDDKVQRFRREARVLSSLSHPRICSLFDIGHEDGKDFLVMELVDGETLEERLKGGALPLTQVLDYAAQIADALAAAHSRGIVHRDLKPGNVMLTKSGVKLLDFGLAKLQESTETAPSGADVSGTSDGQALTSTGVIMGTFPYMSPEQAEGRLVDSRSDIFSFGAMLYEMLTGQRAFEAESPAGLIIAVLQSEPASISSLMSVDRPVLERIVAKCLAKKPDDRWQSAADLRDALTWSLEEPPPRPAVAGRRPFSSIVTAVGVMLTLLAGGGALVWFNAPVPEQSQPPFWVEMVLPQGLREVHVPTLSPSGRELVFEGVDKGGQRQLWLRRLGSREARPLPGTEGGNQAFFSPDGSSIGFFSGGALRRLDLEEGRITVLYEGVGFGASGSWAKDQILFTPNIQDGLLRVSANGGSVAEVTRTDLTGKTYGHVWPLFLPDGQNFLFIQHVGNQAGIHAGRLDSESTRLIVPFDRITSSGMQLVKDHLIFMRGGVLFAQRLDLKTLQPQGEAVRVLDGVSAFGPGFAGFSISQTGHLIYRRDTGWPIWQTVWLDEGGRKIKRIGPAGPYYEPRQFASRPRLSRDARWLALSRRQAGEDPEIWLMDMQRQTALPFITAGYNMSSVLGPDNDYLLYGKVLRSPPSLYYKPLDGRRAEALLLGPEAGLTPERWPSDFDSSGRFVLFSEQSPTSGWDIHVIDMHSEKREASPYTQDNANNRVGKFSPDSRWVVYMSDISGQNELYLNRFPATHSRPIQVAAEPVAGAFWAPDGSAIYYRRSDGALLRVGFDDQQGEPTLSAPELMFSEPDLVTLAMSPDGDRFLALQLIDKPRVQPYVLALNWISYLD